MTPAFEAPIIGRREWAGGHVELLVRHPRLQEALPGQFAHIATGGMLRRPISFSRIDPHARTAGLLFRVVGAGTAWLAARRPGESLDLLAPLGRGFDPPGTEAWCLVGGGVGIPPLYAALSLWHRTGQEITVILGGQTRERVVMVDDFRRWTANVVVTTDDGSCGEAGTVMGPVRRWLTAHAGGGRLYACGPQAMLAAIWRATDGWAGTVQLALEQRMGCGVGACLACVVEGQPVGAEGARYVRVCTEGPGFGREELVFSWT
jgi:dihydroorotate dehydrogenase electron transfer subunit